MVDFGRFGPIVVPGDSTDVVEDSTEELVKFIGPSTEVVVTSIELDSSDVVGVAAIYSVDFDDDDIS